MARRTRSGPLHATGGYPRGSDFTDWNGKTIGKIIRKRCSRVRPGARGSWISSERCSYVVEVNGRRYAGRGRGDGMAVNLRQMRTGLKGGR